MPSPEQIVRTVTVRGNADGVDAATSALNRLTASIQAANDNLSKSTAAARDGSDGWRITGEGAAVAANHLRQAAEAAYLFSPAFRGAVNELRVPAITAAASALQVLGPAMGGVAVTIASRLLPALSLLGRGLLIYDAIKMVGDAWELGAQKLAEYVKISENAAALGLTTDFFQRISKAATDAKQPVDALTSAMAKLRDATSDQLGGTSAQNRLSDLLKAGNFGGNTGVGQLAGANTLEGRFQAISNLIDVAMQKGERLAALDVAKTFLGDAVAGNLAKDSDYLNKMLASANDIKSSDLISQSSIDNAVDLQNRLDAAEKILSQRWHPIQDLLVQGGIAMREVWVNIVEKIAAAVDALGNLLAKLAQVPPWFMQQLNRGATAFMNLTTTPESRAAAESQFGITSNPADIAMLAAKQKLSSGLGNPANVSANTDQINGIQNKIFGDVSKDPNKVTTPDTSAYDRSKESILKYIEVTKAASLSVSDAAAEQEKFKVNAQLTAAAIKDGMTPAAARLKAEMSGLGEQAGAAADALAKAREVSNIDFGRKTAFLSQQDVQIATQLKGIYGNDVPAALNSTYASAIRVNDAFKQVSSAIETNLTQGLTDIAMGSQTAGNAFANMGKMILTAIEQMIIKITIVQPLMKALQNTMTGGGLGGGGLLGLLGFGGSGASYGAASTGASGVGFLGGLYHAGGVVGAEPTAMRYINPAYFDDAPKFHTGGIAGDEVPIIAKRGEGVFTQGQMAAMGGNSGPNITYAPNIDARGADAQAVARLAAALAQDRQNFERNVQAVVGRTRQNNPAFA